MTRIGLIALCVVWAAPAPAAPTPAPQGEIAAVPGGVAVSAASCQALLGGASYVPGVDAKGNAVASADLSRGDADLPREPAAVKPDDILIELDARLAARFGVKPAGGAVIGRSVLGIITVHDGRAYFNGAPLASDETAALAAACAKPTK